MNKIEKFLDWSTLIFFILAPIISAILGKYELLLWQVMTLMWFVLAWARKIKIEEILKDISEYFNQDKKTDVD
jgi:hypothetical protein